jgi:hypothetical protein
MSSAPHNISKMNQPLLYVFRGCGKEEIYIFFIHKNIVFICIVDLREKCVLGSPIRHVALVWIIIISILS